MRFLAILCLLVASSPAMAAEGGVFAQRWNWSYDPWVIICIAVASVAYGAGVIRGAVEGRLTWVMRMRAAAFCGGMLMLILALLSPLDAFAQHLFSAHMAQHLILMMGAPPLIVFGRPAVTMLWALPRRGRHAVGTYWIRSGAPRRITEMIISPLPVWCLASAALWFWHLPKAYDWALDNEMLHTAEHLSFFIPSLLFWGVVLGDAGMGGVALPGRMLFVTTFAIETGMLGAILVFAPHALYFHGLPSSGWSSLTSVEDQQLAGIFMWLTAGCIDLVVLVLLFAAWLGRAERRMARA